MIPAWNRSLLGIVLIVVLLLRLGVVNRRGKIPIENDTEFPNLD